MLVAGLASLPSEPIEAARVDGALALQTLRLVILPLLKPVIAIILVIRFADAFRIFDVVYVLTGSGPGNSTDVLSTFIYRQMFFKFDFAGGSAASILLVVVTALASILARRGAAPRAGHAMSGPADTPLRSALGGFAACTCSLQSSACLFVIPILWIVSTSFKTPGEIFTTPTTLLPQQPTTENYRAVFEGGFRRYLINSLIAASGVTALGLLLGIPAAFGFARYRLPRFSGLLLSFTVVTRIFPPIALALPFFLEFRTLGLIDTPFGLIIAYIPIVFPLMIWILEGFFRDYPEDILEAARIDGLGAIMTLVRIVIPTSLPAIGVATLFGFLVAWNEFVIALTLTRTPAGQTLPVGISTLITQFQTLWGQMMAVAAIYLLPVLRDGRHATRAGARIDVRRDEGLEFWLRFLGLAALEAYARWAGNSELPTDALWVVPGVRRAGTFPRTGTRVDDFYEGTAPSCCSLFRPMARFPLKPAPRSTR